MLFAWKEARKHTNLKEYCVAFVAKVGDYGKVVGLRAPHPRQLKTSWTGQC